MNRRIKGYALIELMIALCLTMIVITACIETFWIVKQIYLTQQAVARIQENARTLYLILGKELRTSGAMGCRSLKSNTPLGLTDDALHGVLPIEKDRIIPRSEILWLQGGRSWHTLVEGTHTSERYLLLSSRPHFKKNRKIVISDCRYIEIAQIVDISKSPQKGLYQIQYAFNEAKKPNRYFKAGSQIGLLSSKVFYVAKTKRKNATQQPIIALYRADLNGRIMEIMEGVEYMEIAYGMRKQQAIHYHSLQEVKDWNSVVSIRITFLLSSIEASLTQSQPYVMHGKTIFPEDKLMRKWWTAEWPIRRMI